MNITSQYDDLLLWISHKEMAHLQYDILFIILTGTFLKVEGVGTKMIKNYQLTV